MTDRGLYSEENFPDIKTVLDGGVDTIRRLVSIDLECLLLSMTKIVFPLEAKVRQVYCSL